MSNQNLQITRFYASLFEVQETIKQNVIPNGIHVGAQTNDYDLFHALENCTDAIQKHLEKFHLKIEEQSND